uniref:Uncharacterized protein n=1 Tax=Lotharella oceanica TaxID=641309 RepID=A0A7S2U3E7_9EUKA|mmetsp:Transcript_8276/g.16251  ORF Transcript_8276/g.16251 Transcript_8276/m.16251 type:complete len:130 (+) Transcript_8276:467-856(+)
MNQAKPWPRTQQWFAQHKLDTAWKKAPNEGDDNTHNNTHTHASQHCANTTPQPGGAQSTHARAPQHTTHVYTHPRHVVCTRCGDAAGYTWLRTTGSRPLTKDEKKGIGNAKEKGNGNYSKRKRKKGCSC